MIVEGIHDQAKRNVTFKLVGPPGKRQVSSGLGPACDYVEQPRLPDPRLSAHLQEPIPAAHFIQNPVNRSQLSLAPDKHPIIKRVRLFWRDFRMPGFADDSRHRGSVCQRKRRCGGRGETQTAR